MDRVRVCALAGPELAGPGLAATLRALRDHRRVSLANDLVALGALERWLRWLRAWLAPPARRNLDAALEALGERLFELRKEERRRLLERAPGAAAAGPGEHADAAGPDGQGGERERWPPLWVCTLATPNDLLRASTEDLLTELRTAQAGAAGLAGDPRRAFGEARRRVAERLLDRHRLEAGRRRCDPQERRWARSLGQETSRALLGAEVAKPVRRELRELGLAIVEDTIDWGTLVKIQGELRCLFGGGAEASGGGVEILSTRGGHARWAILV